MSHEPGSTTVRRVASRWIPSYEMDWFGDRLSRSAAAPGVAVFESCSCEGGRIVRVVLQLTQLSMNASSGSSSEQPINVLISEVTRMSLGNYCVAGLNLDTNKMVRPLQKSGANWALGADRSVFNVGHILECRPTGERGPAMPHATEDTRLYGVPTVVNQLSEDQTYSSLLGSTSLTVVEAIGQRLSENKYVEENAKCRSLGGVRAQRKKLKFYCNSFGKLRLLLADTDGTDYDLPVTCDWLQHFFSPSDEDAEPHFGTDEANEWLDVNHSTDELIIRVGLARPWDGKGKAWNPRRCYLQANGIVCPQDNYYIFSGPPHS